ncbi:MAG: type II and III secretion system protein [Schwartzia sp.]|nr:type II and III secretion system protein [Schwartzia sp. (in: firmicutes)]
MKKRWRRLGAAAILLVGSTFFAPIPVSVVYAAENRSEHVRWAADAQEETQKKSATDDPNYYTRRVQEILDEFHASYDAAHGTGKRGERREEPSNARRDPVPVPANIAPEQPPMPDYYSGERFDYDWQGTPIASSLYAVGKAAGKNIVINGKLEGTVYMSLHDVTCGQALDYLSRSFGFNWMADGDTVIIGTDKVMLQSKTIRLNHISGEKAAAEAKAVGIEEDRIFANTETGTISVTGTSYAVSELARRIKELDHPVSQCLVLAQIIEISHGKNLDLGLTYSLPTYNHSGTTSGRTTSESFQGNWLEKLTFGASVKANKELSKGHVVARPMTMMLNGQEGKVNFSDRVPIMSTTATTTSTDITVTYEDVGTILTITPSINDATGEVRMKIDIEVSNISAWKTFNNVQAPQIAKRQATTSAHLKSGQSFVIGGLMSATELDNLSGIPILMDLPILGKLFSFHSRSKTYAEVYIMITPYIVTDDIDPAAILRKVGD